jgi:ketosteroid isomerase-like protein
MASDLHDLAKSYYRAFERHDRSFLEQNLAADFTFTSPFDDHIGREDYFRRCWPAKPLHQKFDFVTVMQDGDKVFVAYDATMRQPSDTHPEARFRNAELMTFEDGKLKSVEVFSAIRRAGSAAARLRCNRARARRHSAPPRSQARILPFLGSIQAPIWPNWAGNWPLPPRSWAPEP